MQFNPYNPTPTMTITPQGSAERQNLEQGFWHGTTGLTRHEWVDGKLVLTRVETNEKAKKGQKLTSELPL
jgi:hypothetical protein